MLKLGWLGVLLLLVFQLGAQNPGKIKIEARNTPLDQVLLSLKEIYGFQFAFDSDLLSKYTISTNRTFSSEEESLNYLLRNLPLEIEKSGDVFLILPKSDEEPLPETRISGQVLEAFSNEPLPFSYVSVNRVAVQTDQQGNFNFIASADTSFKLQISHLGYFIFDTLLTHSLDRKFYLTPRIERINEVQIVSNPIEHSTLIGDRAGHMKINHQIAPILPGHGDNSIFNLLRLMPGVLAAGEQSNDLLIWGAYESHSKIQFDGFTLFGLKNFNDNISVVNPFMVKNIEVMKGGYEARYGDRVGGIVDIAGKDGSLQKPGFTLNVNTNTVNGMVQVPLSDKSALMAAYRQTYYQLYDPTNLRYFTRREKTSNGKGSDKDKENNGNTTAQTSQVNFDVTPDFVFRDANLKYSYRGDDGSRFSLSFYGGGDRFAYTMEGDVARTLLTRSEEEENVQTGASAQFTRPWKNGDVTNLTAAFSLFRQLSNEKDEVINEKTGVSRVTRLVDAENRVEELRLTGDHTLNFRQGHKLMLGAGAVKNGVSLTRSSEELTTIDIDNNSLRMLAWLQDELPIGKRLELRAGVRANYITNLSKAFIEPRASASLEIIEGLKINASWGQYHQFLSKTTLVDSLLNYSYFWINADEEDIPVLSSEHFVGGLSYNNHGWTASAEAYYKTTQGLNRFFAESKLFDPGFFEGEARCYGLDLFLKKEYKRQTVWVSYTLSQTEEHFSLYLRNYWQPAPHQQKHELKFAGIFNYRRFYLSANYVYGSGFERFAIETESGVKLDQPYNRLDASLVYKFKPGKIKAEAGVSVLNVLNTENIKYSNLRLTTADNLSVVGVYADAVPFTPAVFLQIEF